MKRYLPLDHSLRDILKDTGIFPRGVACFVFWERYEHSKISDERLCELEDEFVKFAESKFVNEFNTNIHFRRQITRVQSIDDLPTIDKWFGFWLSEFANFKIRGFEVPIERTLTEKAYGLVGSSVNDLRLSLQNGYEFESDLPVLERARDIANGWTAKTMVKILDARIKKIRKGEK